MTEMTIKLLVNDEQKQRLEQLLPGWTNHVACDGSCPFANWTIEKLLNEIMHNGCEHVINRCLELEEHRQELLNEEAPVAGTTRESE